MQQLELEEQERSVPKDLTIPQFQKAAAKYCIGGEFVIDENNFHVVQQIIHYANKSSLFEGNLRKGICIAGSFGTGKSVLLKTLNDIAKPEDKFKIDNIVSLAGYYSQKDVGDLAFKTIKQAFLDMALNHRCCNDIGREVKTSQYMGNYEDVGARYIYERYELFQSNRVKTHFTTNYQDADSFIERYGDLNYDRIKEMCNIIFLNGPSRR